MKGEKFDIVFRGKLAAGFEEATVRANLARLFKRDEAQIAPLFSGSRAILKRGVDGATADKYRETLRNAGAIVAVIRNREESLAKPKPPPAPPAFGREVKAAYDGKATFKVDEVPPPTRAEVAGAADDSVEPEAVPVESEQASSEKPTQVLEMPGVAPPRADADAAEDPPDQADVSSAIDEIDTSGLSLVGEGPIESIKGRASYAIDEGPTDSGGRASFAIDESEPKGPDDDQSEDAEEDDLTPLDMPSSSDKEPGSETSSVAPPDTGLDSLDEPPLEKPVQTDPPDIDISALTMSEVGITVDESERPPPVSIDTGDLAAEEDFDGLDEAPPAPAPDIDTDGLDVMEVGMTVDDSERPPAPEIDTSGMSTATDYERLDKAERPAEPDIDTSQMRLEDD